MREGRDLALACGRGGDSVRLTIKYEAQFHGIWGQAQLCEECWRVHQDGSCIAGHIRLFLESWEVQLVGPDYPGRPPPRVPVGTGVDAPRPKNCATSKHARCICLYVREDRGPRGRRRGVCLRYVPVFE